MISKHRTRYQMQINCCFPFSIILLSSRFWALIHCDPVSKKKHLTPMWFLHINGSALAQSINQKIKGQIEQNWILLWQKHRVCDVFFTLAVATAAIPNRPANRLGISIVVAFNKCPLRWIFFHRLFIVWTVLISKSEIK